MLVFILFFCFDVQDFYSFIKLLLNKASHHWTVRAFLPTMLKNNSGHIVTIASISGLFLNFLKIYNYSKLYGRCCWCSWIS